MDLWDVDQVSSIIIKHVGHVDIEPSMSSRLLVKPHPGQSSSEQDSSGRKFPETSFLITSFMDWILLLTNSVCLSVDSHSPRLFFFIVSFIASPPLSGHTPQQPSRSHRLTNFIQKRAILDSNLMTITRSTTTPTLSIVESSNAEVRTRLGDSVTVLGLSPRLINKPHHRT